MKVAELLARRRENWQQLERMCDQVASQGKKSMGAAAISRFATLYRAACADLALADAYQLPPNTVQYLHRIVGRAHNQLYRSRNFDMKKWGRLLLHDAPQRIFNDRCVHFAFLLFWGVFFAAAYLANTDSWPEFSDQFLTPEGKEDMETMFADPIEGRAWADNVEMAGFYIQHNTTIGIQCFASCLLLVPGLIVVTFNAAHLGASFGYMFRPEVAAGENFRHFVTAHGPFELTAIVLSAGAGLRLGMSWIRTKGLTRSASLTKTATESMPLIFAAIIMFALAAMIEGFISPSGLPYWFKAALAIFCSGLLMFYFVVLGFPRRGPNAT